MRIQRITQHGFAHQTDQTTEKFRRVFVTVVVGVITRWNYECVSGIRTAMAKSRYPCLIVILLMICVLISAAIRADQSPSKPKQFIYILRLVPRLHSDANWTNEDKMALDRHFARFQHSIETGELILAGRTSEPGDKTFGIAIFEAKDEPAARAYMESDPAVVAGLMTAELHPFAIALQRKNP
jgi:uncharacterized protein